MQLDWHRAWFKRLCAVFKDPLQRERDRIRAEIHGIHGLVRLFMKQRNGARWMVPAGQPWSDAGWFTSSSEYAPSVPTSWR
jgi:hypothetical protein